MSDAPGPKLITELQASAHLMLLEAGVYCVYHTPGSAPPDPRTGLPGARLSLPPGATGQGVAITGFREDGWLGALDSAALIRVSQGPAQVLMTIYQDKQSQHEPPKLQVTRLVEGPPAAAPLAPPAPPPPAIAAPNGEEPEIAAHVQTHGDVLARLGRWVGERASGLWVEGFALSPRRAGLAPEDIEYQAVLGRGWLSPWAEGGQYCGSRGMALPILGLRVRLRGKAAETHTVQVDATFTDGTAVGPVGAGDAVEAESLAPLEAFCITVLPQGQKPARQAAPRQAARPAPPRTAKPASPAKRTAKPIPAAKPAARSVAAKPVPKKPGKPAPRGRGR